MTDRRTDGQTDGGEDCNIPNAFLKKRGDNNLRARDMFMHILKMSFRK